MKHTSALHTHYDKEASTYDLFNEKNSEKTNQLIEQILSEHKVKTVLDFTSGTGSQVFYLSSKGFDVVGYDISPTMIAQAQAKAEQASLNLSFHEGDMRTTQAGEFDAVITIFNSIGHLTKQDFKKTIHNIGKNLKADGLYIFDIFNLDYLLHKDNITKLTIDWLKKSEDKIRREIQYSTINQEGVLASHDIYYEEKKGEEPTTSYACQTLQVYNRVQLTKLLESSGFKIVEQTNIKRSALSEKESERILTVAQKI